MDWRMRAGQPAPFRQRRSSSSRTRWEMPSSIQRVASALAPSKLPNHRLIRRWSTSSSTARPCPGMAITVGASARRMRTSCSTGRHATSCRRSTPSSSRSCSVVANPCHLALRIELPPSPSLLRPPPAASLEDLGGTGALHCHRIPKRGLDRPADHRGFPRGDCTQVHDPRSRRRLR